MIPISFVNACQNVIYKYNLNLVSIFCFARIEREGGRVINKRTAGTATAANERGPNHQPMRCCFRYVDSEPELTSDATYGPFRSLPLYKYKGIKNVPCRLIRHAVCPSSRQDNPLLCVLVALLMPSSDFNRFMGGFVSCSLCSSNVL